MNQRADDSESFGGELGETQTSRIPIRTDDGDVFRAEVYTTVNVAEDPELREELVAGTLNEVTGPSGEGTFEPAVSVRYHDPEHKVFALVIPDTLRHQSFELRGDLLEDLSEADAAIPDYVSNFAVVFDPDELEYLEETGTGRLRRVEGSLGDEFSVPEPSEIGGEGGERVPTPESDATRGPGAGGPEGRELGGEENRGADSSAEIDREWEKIEEMRAELETREAQLEEVRDRIDRERRQMDEYEKELAAEREELRELRAELDRESRELEAERLNLEEKSRRLDRGESASTPEENTQVVTDDQFIEVAAADESGNVLDPDSVPTTPVEPSTVEPPGGAERTFDIEFERLETGELTEEFDESAAGEADGYATLEEGRVVVACQLARLRIDAFTDQPPRFYVQYHSIDDFPLVALTIGLLDDEEAVVDSYGWPFDLQNDRHETILNRLSESTELDIAFYGSSGEIEAGYRVRAPYEQNVEWIRDRVETRLEEIEDDERASFEEAAAIFRSEDYERIGSMRHNFDRDAFRQLDSVSQIKLAAGVVGFWSSDEQFEYLVSNRTYPIDLFRRLQEEVVEAAVEAGICLDSPLRELAVEMGISADEIELVERQLSNFAEVTVQIRSNDLDPIDEWENWDALIELASSVGVTPDPDVLELAEASLQRAKDFQETNQVEPSSPELEEGEADEPGLEGESSDATAEEFIEDPAAVDVDELVVSKRSETTGVEYYLPDDAVIDTFDDLADMPREDLERLLEDSNGRLEAAQMLLERFDVDVVPEVLEAAEQMSAPEVTALARFVETKAEGLEPELVRAVETGGPSATFVAARALAHIKSTTAIPTLIEAYRDSDRRLNHRAVARSMASYGAKFVPPLVRSIREDGANDRVVTLLAYLEQQEAGILEELSKERDEEVRDAAERASERSAL